MKIVIIGGGAHRVLGILRGALAIPGMMDGGEMNIFDLNPARAEAMGRMLLLTPEKRTSDCRIKWSDTLERALAGADVAGVIMPAGSRRAHALGSVPSLRHGFISSDNLSPNGALAAVRIAPTLLEIARKMEVECPNAWLINFVNPIAPLSSMVNNHTKIRALGVCQGFTNHLWDISRLMGADEEARNLEVTAAGNNHLSYILSGKWDGGDLMAKIASCQAIRGGSLKLQPWWSEAQRCNIQYSISRLVRFWKDLGILLFSTEGDGMDHLMYEEAVEAQRQTNWNKSVEEIDRDLQSQALGRQNEDRSFQACLTRNLDAAFWDQQWKTDLRFKRQDEDVFVRIFAAIAGIKEAKIATSRANAGAIRGIKERHVVEYTQRLFRNDIHHDGPYEIPDIVHGLTASFAAHQTLLGDALAVQDPKMLAQALISYPMQSYSRQLRLLYRELLDINEMEIAPAFRKTKAYLEFQAKN